VSGRVYRMLRDAISAQAAASQAAGAGDDL